jgi:uncharacterized protein YggE
MKTPAFLLALAFAGAVGSAPVMAANGTTRVATLTVSGEGSVMQPPDRATVSFRIESIDEQAARATSQNNTIAAALTDALVRAGVERAAIKTAGYSVSYNPRPPRPDPNVPQRYGYSVSRTVSAAVDRTDTAGALIDAGVAAGVTGINGVTFSLKDPRRAQRAALTAAVADAEDQARVLATATHVKLVRLLEIVPSGGLQMPIARPLGARMAMSTAVPTEIDPGDLTARATVTLRYEVAP